MEIKCPSCKKVNIGFRSCKRCGCDLEALEQIIEAACNEMTRSKMKLMKSKSLEALDHAIRSWELKKSSDAAKLIFLSYIAENRFSEALGWYKISEGYVYG